jgi:hypothetical protein
MSTVSRYAHVAPAELTAGAEAIATRAGLKHEREPACVPEDGTAQLAIWD